VAATLSTLLTARATAELDESTFALTSSTFPVAALSIVLAASTLARTSSTLAVADSSRLQTPFVMSRESCTCFTTFMLILIISFSICVCRIDSACPWSDFSGLQ